MLISIIDICVYWTQTNKVFIYLQYKKTWHNAPTESIKHYNSHLDIHYTSLRIQLYLEINEATQST